MKMHKITMANNSDFHELHNRATRHARTSHNSIRHYLPCGGWMDSTGAHGLVYDFGIHCPLAVIETKEQREFARKCEDLLALKGTISDEEYKARAMELMA